MTIYVIAATCLVYSVYFNNQPLGCSLAIADQCRLVFDGHHKIITCTVYIHKNLRSLRCSLITLPFTHHPTSLPSPLHSLHPTHYPLLLTHHPIPHPSPSPHSSPSPLTHHPPFFSQYDAPHTSSHWMLSHTPPLTNIHHTHSNSPELRQKWLDSIATLHLKYGNYCLW